MHNANANTNTEKVVMTWQSNVYLHYTYNHYKINIHS